jgi:hypothetical protein
MPKAARRARERIDIRLRPEQKTEIERAAHIKGLTITDFIIQNAVTNARQAIREYETWTLERPDVVKGDSVFLTESVDGFRITPYDPQFEEQMSLAHKFMRNRRDALRELAK